MRITTKIKTILILLMVAACIDPYDISNNGLGAQLVVEGVLSNQLKRHRISLSRSTPLTVREIVPEVDAVVTITDQNNNSISLSEETPGIYETPEFSASAGNSYTLHITTADGREYRSASVPFQDGPDMTDVYGKFIKTGNRDTQGIQIYVDTEDPANKSQYYRWSYVETYEVHAPFPSNWIWLGNNEVTFRIDGIDTCYVTDTLKTVMIRNTKNLDKNQVIAQEIRFIPEVSYLMRYRYSILVQQFCMSEESFRYWENLKKMSEQQGSLADQQPGSLPGNIFSVDDPDENALGYFDVGRVSEKRIFLSAIQFYNEGFKMPENLREYCYDIAPYLIAQQELDIAMQRFGRTMLIWELFGQSPAITIELMPAVCCDCRDLGSTEKPAFFRR
jgi:hypothetical protein